MIKAILAHGLNGEIGQNGDMPWGKCLPKDLEYFKEVTTDHPVLMGWNTFESLPFIHGLPNRENWVATRKEYLVDMEQCFFRQLDIHINFYNKYTKVYPSCDLWVIGGASIYKQMEHLIDEYHITEVQSKFPEADTFFKPDLYDFEMVGEEIDVGNGELEAFVQVWKRVK